MKILLGTKGPEQRFCSSRRSACDASVVDALYYLFLYNKVEFNDLFLRIPRVDDVELIAHRVLHILKVDIGGCYILGHH